MVNSADPDQLKHFLKRIYPGPAGQAYLAVYMGAQWLSGRVLDSRPRGHGFKPHYVVS